MPSSVTVSIVNFNHRHYLPQCLAGLAAQSLPPTEVIITDNDSQDGSQDWLASNAGQARVILNDSNVGFAAAHNHAIRAADSDFVLVLNCDVVLDKDFLAAMTTALEQSPAVGSASGRLYLNGESDSALLDSTGLVPDRFRRFRDRSHQKPDAAAPISGPIFGPSGSAAFLRRAMLEDIAFEGEYFDEDMFAYCEDADLAWRARRAGWTSLFVREAVAYHVHADLSRVRSSRSDADARFRQMLLIRNRHLCFLKNDSPRELLRDLPWLVGYGLALEAYLLVTKPKLAIGWPIQLARKLPRTLAKRRAVFARPRSDVRLADWFARG